MYWVVCAECTRQLCYGIGPEALELTKETAKKHAEDNGHLVRVIEGSQVGFYAPTSMMTPEGEAQPTPEHAEPA